jgi:SWI/SNF-related matrix-associated actin-dependent regulator 1 of chromatin subfamily A
MCVFAAYNDYQLHTFCMTYHGLLGQYMLPPTCLMASGKLVALDALLKELKAAGSRPLIFSQVN